MGARRYAWNFSSRVQLDISRVSAGDEAEEGSWLNSHFKTRRRCHSFMVENYRDLLHIMCGYQCDKAVNKNDTREVIWYHFTSEMISYHFTGLNCPIKYIVIIWLDQSGCTFYFRFRLTLGVKFGGKNCFGRRNCFAVLSTLSCTSTWWLDFF